MYTYAFCATPNTPLLLPRGMKGAVQLVGNAQLSALVEAEFDLETIQAQDEKLLEAVLVHDRVLRDFFRQTPILPLRFGTRFASLDCLQAHLAEHQTDYLVKLRNIAGKAEYPLKLIPQEVSANSDTTALTGREYFLARKQHYQDQLAQQQQQQIELQQLVKTVIHTYPNPVFSNKEGDEHRIYLLVNRQNEPDLLQHLKTWQQQCPHWQLQLGEAVPPYHFV